MANKHQQLPATWGIRSCFRSLVALLFTVLVITAVYMAQNNGEDKTAYNMDSGECNFFNGKWVFDNKTYPLYKEKQCTFMSDQLACEKFGRNDLNYQNWRWQPHQCDIPRFNATALLERLRNKRLVFVGDSLNRGQWVSMVCLVDKSIPHGLKFMHHNGSLITVKFTEYNVSIEFYWAPLLVESNSDDPVNHRLPDRIVRVQSIEKHAKYWTDADVLVFNSYLWWRRSKMMVLWGSFESPDGIYKESDEEVKMPRVYEMALRTWADWLEVHVNRNKTQLFFVTMSPTHQSGEEWGGDKDQSCYNETELLYKDGYSGAAMDPKIMGVVDKTLDDLKTRGVNVQIINITQLSGYRKEGHPSIYKKQWEPLTEEELTNPSSYADCIHWCLPGVPDVWNEILYAYIL
ncbi:PC-Esterase domain-containing protein/PMR5N domain-containing protein [Cephalotus follicularis]|uniref:PC-Esterase domain-containing protein/PMR5N domain-containing protein n=1 Tax=Cephalotus follicularis TaxID=3775 RepID=A0A1Q3C9X7_CEPFO|nr:PC-Esterase domain-containing protein/PMR5N domain-containing protein [Cephalotus follicularis]